MMGAVLAVVVPVVVAVLGDVTWPLRFTVGQSQCDLGGPNSTAQCVRDLDRDLAHP